MLVNKNGGYLKSTIYSNRKWVSDEGYYIIDETTEEGRQMAQTYIKNWPFVDFEHDGEFVTKVIVLDKPERPPEIEGKSIELIKNEQGEWEYIYVDIPLTPEQELKKVKQELADTNAMILEFMEAILMGGM